MKTPPINSWHPDIRLPEDSDRLDSRLLQARAELAKMQASGALRGQTIPIGRKRA